MRIIIPARKDSKGLPFKNRQLFKHTADIIPDIMKHKTYVSTDDTEIIKIANNYGFKTVFRSSEVSKDETSTKETMKYTLNKIDANTETIVMLYLTYPERTWSDVNRAIAIYKCNEIKSLLCKKKLAVSPFLTLKSEPDNRGSQLFYHDMYRRQDYPECFEISHFISIFRSDEIEKLNNNLYNKDTYFLDILDSTIDIDEQKDLDRFEKR